MYSFQCFRAGMGPDLPVFPPPGQVWALIYLHNTPRTNTRTVFHILLSTLLWTDMLGKMLTTAPAIASYVTEHWAGGGSYIYVTIYLGNKLLNRNL